MEDGVNVRIGVEEGRVYLIVSVTTGSCKCSPFILHRSHREKRGYCSFFVVRKKEAQCFDGEFTTK